MTRGEEIKKASDELFKTGSCSKTYRMGFEVGAMWADNNPKSPWISVDEDLPCNHPELITCESSIYSEVTISVIAVIHGFIIMSRMYKENDKWHWENDEPTYWMLIPEPPKE